MREMVGSTSPGYPDNVPIEVIGLGSNLAGWHSDSYGGLWTVTGN